MFVVCVELLFALGVVGLEEGVAGGVEAVGVDGGVPADRVALWAASGNASARISAVQLTEVSLDIFPPMCQKPAG